MIPTNVALRVIFLDEPINHARGHEGKTQALGVGYQYDLSKRTALYSSLTRFKNEGVGYAARGAGVLPANLVTGDDRNITEFVAGVRHSF